jgi:hypothetical protein
MKILVIPDCQVKPGIPTEHLEWAGKAIVDYRPDVVVNIGDFADMPSLSTHDKVGSKYFEGKRYKDDIAFAKMGMKKMLKPLRDLQASQKVNKQKVYKPRMVLTLGNHENRIDRAVTNNPILEGSISQLLLLISYICLVSLVISRESKLPTGNVLMGNLSAVSSQGATISTTKTTWTLLATVTGED